MAESKETFKYFADGKFADGQLTMDIMEDDSTLYITVDHSTDGLFQNVNILIPIEGSFEVIEKLQRLIDAMKENIEKGE